MGTQVGLLSTRDHPLLPYFLDHVAGLRGIQLVLVLDRKGFGAKDARIFQERTEGAFPFRVLEPFLATMAAVEVSSHNGPDCHEVVRKEGLDLLVNAGTPRILDERTLAAARSGVLNAHPGILPKYRGASCCEWALHNGDPVGVTAHFMDARIDGGPILFSRELPVHAGMTYTSVRVALYNLAHEVRAEAIAKVIAEGLRAADLPPQPDGPVFRPIPDELLEAVKARLARGVPLGAQGLPPRPT